MNTKVITKNMVINAFEKDLVILEKQKKMTEDYIKEGCGQFLNVGNDGWCGGFKEVIRLYEDMINFANESIKELNKTKEEEYSLDYVYDIFESIGQCNESYVFLTAPKESSDSGYYHHSLFSNFCKLIEK